MLSNCFKYTCTLHYHHTADLMILFQKLVHPPLRRFQTFLLLLAALLFFPCLSQTPCCLWVCATRHGWLAEYFRMFSYFLSHYNRISLKLNRSTLIQFFFHDSYYESTGYPYAKRGCTKTSEPLVCRVRRDRITTS